MPELNVTQTDFLAGEISPRMEFQDNLEGRKHGVELMQNFFPHLQGSAETVQGLEWKRTLTDTHARIFGLKASETLNVVVIIGTAFLTIADVTDLSDINLLVYTASIWPTKAIIDNIQVVSPPNESSLYVTCSDISPTQILYTASTDTWAINSIALTDPPAAWGTGSYPVAAGFYGGRLWLGGASSSPNTFWGSKPADYTDFTLGDLADDAIEEDLSYRGSIRWISGGQGLLIGTENAEHVVSASGGILIPGDVQTKLQSTSGSISTQAVQVGNETMYISPDGRKIRAIGYEWDKDAWRSRDITYASEHITGEGNAIKSLAFASNPNSLLLGVTLLGNLVIGAYEPYSQTVGFARRTTQGSILSVASLASGGYDEIWAIVDRDTGGLQVEKTTLDENVKLDSYMAFEEAGLYGGTVPHLALKECQVLLDGAVHPNVTPDENGDFLTEITGSTLYIGLKIDSKIISLPIEGAISNVGSTRPMKKRITEVGVKVLSSWRPKINGQRTPNRRASTLMGTGEEARTEVVRVSNSGWGDEVQVTIEQDLPLPTEVSGWFAHIIQEET